MKILITNDDGIDSEGLHLLCQKLAKNHEVYVVAPEGQRSATSHCANFYKKIYVKKVEDFNGATQAYTCTGSPADCVKFAESVLEIPFDLLVSGPNNGENTGNAILYSGTIGAAEEGVLCGYNSIALSRLGRNGSFETAVDFFVENVEKLAAFNFPNTLLNVNVPDLPKDQIKGVKVVRDSVAKLYKDYMEKQPEEDCWVSTGFRIEMLETEHDTDVVLSEEGYVTISPLTVVRTDFEVLKKLQQQVGTSVVFTLDGKKQ